MIWACVLVGSMAARAHTQNNAEHDRRAEREEIITSRHILREQGEDWREKRDENREKGEEQD